MEQVTELIIPFISLAILSAMIDKVTLFLEGIMNRVPKLPDKFEWWIAYFIVLMIAYTVCWQGDYSLFDYLNFDFEYKWEGYLLTALVISGGSTFVRSQFEVINEIPSSLSGITSMFRKVKKK